MRDPYDNEPPRSVITTELTKWGATGFFMVVGGMLGIVAAALLWNGYASDPYASSSNRSLALALFVASPIATTLGFLFVIIGREYRVRSGPAPD